MNIAQFVWYTAAILFVLLPISSSPGPQSEIVRKKEFDNGQILIERTIIPPGFRGEMHTHEAASLEIFITDDHIQETLPDGSVRDWRAKAGELACIEPVAHGVRNLRNAPTEIISIEFKGAPMKSCPKVDPQAVAAGVEFENALVRITRGKLGPQQTGSVHSHPEYVGIFLTDAKLRLRTADGAVLELEGKRGFLRSSGPVTHSVENLADTPFEALDINLKPPAGQLPKKP